MRDVLACASAMRDVNTRDVDARDVRPSKAVMRLSAS